MRRARQLFTEESMEAMIKYYEGETLGLGGKTAGSPGVGLQAHLFEECALLHACSRSKGSARARPACFLRLLH